ncbi:hypothetical protein HBE96_25150 [Clostridium sp. P21]|uniref:Lipoprotein n=1 Tax=Clostridium muellerianum TaxID=2716538 RepID=A0A7Y0HSI3_9CLOT|nr:hypothetical protein [Clostridium muellerianum]NMM65868.1 hypothetical protein [Clostridium muellerianum]
MSKKKVIVITTLLLAAGIGCLSLTSKFNVKNVQANQSNQISQDASYKKIHGVKELKSKSNLIAEVEGTNKYKIIDDKGIKFRVTTVKVQEVIKGDKQLKEFSIIQTEGLSTEKPPQNGEKLLMFLRKSLNMENTYIPLGGSQGTYDITTITNPSKSSTNNIESMNNTQNKDENKKLIPNEMVNDEILKDLSGNYSDIKKNLAQ